MSGRRSAEWLKALRREGFCILPGLIGPEEIASLEADLCRAFERTPFSQGDFYGYRTKRFGSLLRRSPVMERLVLEPTILAMANAVLGDACERIQLNVAQAIEIHPGEVEQFPHRDHDMWPCSKAGKEYLLNVIWPLSPFSAANGATRIYPGTNRLELEALGDLPAPVVAECAAGSAICILGSTIHGAGANRSASVRRALVTGYSLGWLKPYENLWLAYPPEVARDFSPALAELAGYVQHRPNLGNYEGQCPSVLLTENRPSTLPAIDALRGDQQAAVREFAESRRLAG
jgi:ectoine hydroxylase-related dioxygenase (phytanoyl-CoA dioxygenase family)